MNKEIEDALHMLLHCSLKDTEYETQREQFEFIYKYIENLEEENQELHNKIDKAIEYIESKEYEYGDEEQDNYIYDKHKKCSLHLIYVYRSMF